MKLKVAYIYLVLVALLLPGCTGETKESATESNRWLELLSIIPANESTLKSAYLQDFTYYSEQLQQYPGVTEEYTVTHPHDLIGFKGYDEEEWKQTLGFTAKDVEQSIYAGVSDKIYEAVRGNFTHEDIDNAAKTGPMNDQLEIVTYNGYEFYSWGKDYEMNLKQHSLLRIMGRGHRLGYIDGFACWVLWTDGMKEMIDSHRNNIDSLADIDDYRLMADALEEYNINRAFFSSASYSQANIKKVLTDEVYTEALSINVYVKPYRALATGSGINEDGYYLMIVLLNPDEETAEQNAVLLEQQINEAKESTDFYMNRLPGIIEKMEISSQGVLTIACIYGPATVLWHEFNINDRGLKTYIPLLMHE